MQFGWINVFGAVIVLLLMIPNLIYAARNKAEAKPPAGRAMMVIEQIGRYACIILMWLPLAVREFGFGSVAEMLIYIIGNGVLLLLYYIFWGVYFRSRKMAYAAVLAILPVCMFLLSGLLLRHWLLVAGAVLFAAGHLYVTVKSHSAVPE